VIAPVRAALAAAARGARAPLVIVHRGIWRDGTPENSLAAIAAARDYDMVEIDLQLSADGVPVLMHDPTCLRTAGQDTAPRTRDRAALARLRLRVGAGGEGAALSDQCIPTLDQALAAGGPELLFDLDVKTAGELPAVARFMAKRPERERCLLKLDLTTPADAAVIRAVEARHGITVIAKALIREPADLALIDAAAGAGLAAAEIWCAEPGLMQAAVATGIPITTYTLDAVHNPGLNDAVAVSAPKRVWGALRQTGLAGIMTDAPEQLRCFLTAAGAGVDA
jgi:glycerophosphoryl diester phosphodiesterase